MFQPKQFQGDFQAIIERERIIDCEICDWLPQYREENPWVDQGFASVLMKAPDLNHVIYTWLHMMAEAHEKGYEAGKAAAEVAELTRLHSKEDQ